MEHGQAARRLLLCLSGEEDFSRMAAPLWARVGRTVTLGNLDWATKLLGAGGDILLWEALVEAGALQGEAPVLRAEPLATFLNLLVRNLVGRNCLCRDGNPKIVWTLPDGHPFGAEAGRSYAKALVELIDSACSELVLMAPFIEEQGVKLIFDALLRALGRMVCITVLAHGLEDLSSASSHALKGLQHEAERIRMGSLCVYAARKDRVLHAKLAIADGERLLVGSANLTGAGLGVNFEAGVILGREPAREALAVLEGIVRVGLAQRVFGTGKDGVDRDSISESNFGGV